MRNNFVAGISCVVMTGYADQAYVIRWNEMWADIAIRQEYEKYSCASGGPAQSGQVSDANAPRLSQ
jgi:hypothetical protein